MIRLVNQCIEKILVVYDRYLFILKKMLTGKSYDENGTLVEESIVEYLSGGKKKYNEI